MCVASQCSGQAVEMVLCQLIFAQVVFLHWPTVLVGKNNIVRSSKYNYFSVLEKKMKVKN